MALGASLHVPDANVIAATIQAKPPYLTPIGRCHIGNDAADDNILHRLAVRAAHGRDLLPEQSTSFVHIGFVSTSLTAVFQFPSHCRKVENREQTHSFPYGKGSHFPAKTAPFTHLIALCRNIRDHERTSQT